MLSSLAIHSQILKERRVYYLDCSYSMKQPNGIWDEVKENLKNAIEKVTDETTELVVVPFAFDKIIMLVYQLFLVLQHQKEKIF